MSIYNASPLQDFHSSVKHYLEGNTPRNEQLYNQYVSDLVSEAKSLGIDMKGSENTNDNQKTIIEYLKSIDRRSLNSSSGINNFIGKMTDCKNEVSDNDDLSQSYRGVLVKLIKVVENDSNNSLKREVLKLIKSL